MARRRRTGDDDGRLLAQTSEFAGWPIKLIQWFFVLMYASAVWSKLSASGLDWANGFTLQYYLARDGLRWDSPLGYWLSQYHILILLAQYGVLLFQATFALAVIFPKLRWIYVPAGLCLHIGIYLTLKAPFFQWIALYAVFIPWAEALQLLRARLRPHGQPAAPGSASGMVAEAPADGLALSSAARSIRRRAGDPGWRSDGNAFRTRHVDRL